MKDALSLSFHRTLSCHSYSFALRFLHYIYSMKNIVLFVISIACPFSAIQAQNLSKTMTYADTTRTYRIYIPSIYNSSQPVPLVMALHGLGDNANNFQGVGFNQIANTENFIAVYPNALTDPLLGAAGWSAGMNPLNDIDDVGFLNALMDTIQSEYSIDTNRIYACGFSMGGFMTHKLACESGSRLAAIASVAGTLPATSVATCSPSHSMPVLHIHGTSDQTIPYDYGVIFFVVTNLGADSTTHYWAEHNGCTSPATWDSVPNTKNDGLTFEKFSYAECNDSSEVILFKATGMTHTWPFSPTNDIDATEEIWDFFSRHQKAAPDTTNTGVAEVAQLVTISPNPASGQLLITSNAQSAVKILLTDLSGKELYRNEFSGSAFHLDLSSYNKGIYFLRLSNEGSSVTKKIVVSR